MITGKRREQVAEHERTVARVRGALEGYAAGGAESVPVAHVLDLLEPHGLWSTDPGGGKGAREAPEPPRRDDVDPVTGCRSVAPPAA